MLYSTFVTGLQEPISEWVAQEGGRVRQILDGAIIYDSVFVAGQPVSMPCFFNTFTVLAKDKGSVEQLMRKVLRNPPNFNPPGFNPSGLKRKRGGSFRLVTSKENQLIAVDKKLRSDVEKLVSARTGATPDRRGGGHEFWFLSRSEGVTLFMERRQAPREPKLKKGELRPQLAYCLNRLANPTPEDIMIDPFCGYGAIPAARARYFPCREIHALDIDMQKIKGQKIKALPAGIKARRADISEIFSIFPAQSADVIVTDPPWGVFEAVDGALYENLAKACKHLLRPGGRAVILTAQKELVQEWQPKARYDILVSGQKAAVFVF